MVFVDGLGVGENDPDINPLTRHPELWPTADGLANGTDTSFVAIDACLGVEGLPQSATGQTALLTGVNAPGLVGRHLQGFPSRKLIEVLKRDSLFVRLNACGVKATFANAYRHPEDIGPASRLSVTSHAFKAGGQPFRSVAQIPQGEALYHDFTNRSLKDEGYKAPRLSPEKAAEILVAIAGRHSFTLYEHFLTDIVGHRGNHKEIARQTDQLSRFIKTVLQLCQKEGINVVITSDHGNVEDGRVKTHTRNPVPLIWSTTPPIAVDPLPKDITGIAPWFLRLLGCER
jgi:hypothetical protein